MKLRYARGIGTIAVLVAVIAAAAYTVPGLQARFDGTIGGIADTLGKWKDEAMKKAPGVTLTTTTLDEILMRAGAPTFIHFMSLDIEGAELDALRGLSLDRYRFGAMAIEHNFEEPRRTQIRQYLKQYGYVNVHSYKWDDFYAPAASERH